MPISPTTAMSGVFPLCNVLNIVQYPCLRVQDMEGKENPFLLLFADSSMRRRRRRRFFKNVKPLLSSLSLSAVSFSSPPLVNKPFMLIKWEGESGVRI